MKISPIFLLILLCSTSVITKSQVVNENIKFDYYLSPTDNDLQNHFYSGLTTLVQDSIHGITGGCLITPNSNNWGNDNAMYCSKYRGQTGVIYTTSIAFKYDTTQINTINGDREVSIWMNPSSDWNHYIIASISGPAGVQHIQILTYSWVNSASPTLNLQQDNWYNYSLTVTYTGGVSGDQIDIQALITDLGASGTNPPIPVGFVNGSINDSILFNDLAITVAINGSHWGGASVLDNFQFSGVKSADSCLSTQINKSFSDPAEVNGYVENGNLIIQNPDQLIGSVIEIYNVNGQRLQRSTIRSTRTSLNISTLASGIYFCTILTDNSLLTKKIQIPVN